MGVSTWSDDFSTDYFGDGSGSTRYVTARLHHADPWEVPIRLGPGDLLVPPFVGSTPALVWLDPLGVVPSSFDSIGVNVTLSMEAVGGGIGSYEFMFGWFQPLGFVPPDDFAGYDGNANTIVGVNGRVSAAADFTYLSAEIANLGVGDVYDTQVWPAGLDLTVHRQIWMTLDSTGQLVVGGDGLPTSTVRAPAGAMAAFQALADEGLIFPFVEITADAGNRVHVHDWGYSFTPASNPGSIAAMPKPGGIIRTDQQGFVGAVAGAARGAF